ncbi:MAG: hypothetical protein KGZ74_15550 [Chitinophagaceae bacterium]|nr:hypothetical protein [Chitinophagaceae bacterium]
MQKVLLQKPQVETIGRHIGYEAGEEMVKRFYDKHPEQAYGNIVGRDIIEQILAQPNCAGVTILPAYNDQGFRQSVLVGIDKQGQPILNFNVVNASGQIVSQEGIVADRMDTGWGGKEEETL